MKVAVRRMESATRATRSVAADVAGTVAAGGPTVLFGSVVASDTAEVRDARSPDTEVDGAGASTAPEEGADA
jgi:hypothetical protein